MTNETEKTPGESNETPAQNAPPEDTPAGEPTVAELKSEIAALKDRVLRAMAEAENVRRRAEKDKADARDYAVTGFARDMVSVADNLRRALDALPTELHDDERLKTFVDGVQLTERELMNAFERHGIRRIEPTGEKFDHNLHQAMFEVADSGQPAGTVVQVMQAGYVIKDRLLRAAMVGVAKRSADGAEGDQGGGDGDEPKPEGVDTTV